MKIKLDENIPLTFSNYLTQMGHQVDTVLHENLKGHQDSEIWKATQRVKRFFITQDLDFSDIRKFSPGTHAGILLVRLRSPSLNALLQKLQQTFQVEDVENWRQCLVILSDNKIRVLREKKTNN